MGFIIELPGAFIRGPTENEALSKTHAEAVSYLKWSGDPLEPPVRIQVVQRHLCKLMVEDADCEILLDADRSPASDQEFGRLVELVKYSGLTFALLYDSVVLKDWVDEARIRKTFYGQSKKTIREIFDHVKRTQHYYLSRTGVSFTEDKEESFMSIRDSSIETLTSLWTENGNSRVYDVDNEEWTLKKILRRFIWHDRIHGKAIHRILKKQKSLELIRGYEDPFRFET